MKHRRNVTLGPDKPTYVDYRSQAACTCTTYFDLCPRCTPVNYATTEAKHRRLVVAR